MDKAIIEETLNEIEKFNKFKASHKEKLPFQFNIIDELHANENAHSRLVAKLFEYKELDSYPFLVSFLGHTGFDKVVKSPVVSVETHRIDCLIRDDDYAIIIENKIHNAVDQGNQIERYVEIVNEKYKLDNKEYKLEQIYVIYLTRDGNKKVTENSLPSELIEKLGSFYECNFKHNVLPWLQDDVLPLCKFNDTILISGVQQYIDYLNGLFLMREDLRNIDKKMKEYLSDELKLSSNLEQNTISILDEKINNLDNYSNDADYSNTLRALRTGITDSLRKDFLKKLYSKLKLTGEKWECVRRIDTKASLEDFNKNNFGFRLTKKSFYYDGQDLFVNVNVEIRDGSFLCGIFLGKEDPIREKLKAKFESHNVPIKETSLWFNLTLDEYEIGGQKIAHNFYDPNWDSLYIDDMDGVVDMFYTQIRKFIDTLQSEKN